MFAKLSLIRRSAAMAAAALLLAACSTADYGKPVDDFAAATHDAETVLAQLNAQLTEAYTEVLRGRILQRRLLLKTESGDCLVESSRCRLVVIDENGRPLLDGLGRAQVFPPNPPLTNMTLVMSAIEDYAANLKSLLEADTAQQVEGQVNAALASVQILADTVAKASTAEGAPPPSVPAFATPAGAAVNWVVGQYVERVKLRGLQDATAAARPVVRDAAALFETTAQVALLVPRSQLAEEVSTASDSFRSAGNGSNLDKLTASAAKYDALLTTSPQLFRRLGEAHHALADSLQGGEVTIGTAIARIEAFAAEAKKLAKILKDLRAVFPEDEEG